MRQKESSFIDGFLSHNYRYPIILALSYSAAFYSFFDPVVNAIKRGDWLVCIVYISFFVFVLFIGYLLRPKQMPAQPPQKGIFKGVGKLEIEDAWPRTDDRNKLCETIKKTFKKPIILVGSSGVGKSVLLETQVVPSLKREGWKTISFSNYDDIQSLLLDNLTKTFPNLSHNKLLNNAELEGIDTDTKLLLIYDQFEQFLSIYGNKKGKRSKIRKWFRDFLESSTRLDNIKQLIIVRKESYYDLRFLEQYVPPPIESFHLSGIKMDENESGRLVLRQKMNVVTKNIDMAEKILNSLVEDDEILPVKAQIVGLMLENKSREVGAINTEYYLKDLEGKDGLIQNYFQSYLQSSPDSEIALQVLFALSVETKLRGQLSLPQIADIVHKNQHDVYKCLLFFTKEGLIRTTDIGKYELTHDYLAEKFHELSGTELDPVERDNILFFWDEMRKASGKLEITRPQPKSNARLVFSDYFMIFLGVLLIARLFGPAYNVDWGWLNILNNYQMNKVGIDIYYAPVFVSHLAWAIYVTLFYRRMFSIRWD